MIISTGLAAPQLSLANNVAISSEASAALGAGVRISSNVYIVGFSSAAKYYGDGSGLTGVSGADNLGNHIATKNLNMSGFDIVNVSTLTVSSITTTAAQVTFSTNVFVSGNVGIGTPTPAAKMDVTSTGNPGEYIAVFHSGNKLAAWLRNK
jgi:acetyltransferase-like isoleucine patch superfamily enzyme